jgi:hypothetical protein
MSAVFQNLFRFSEYPILFIGGKTSVVDLVPYVFGPPYLDPTLFVRIRIQILPSTSKKSKKPLDFYYF